ncbi:MAG: hypothetical protein KAQ94_05310 [Arcobacteraceae bacterium]|nr:hypothetical protein [Arcobacteraceae bacterium]
MSHYFKKELNYKVILITIKSDIAIVNKNYSKVIEVENQKQIIKTIYQIQYDFIINRGWMHAYQFSAKIVKNFPETIVIIKDWNFSTKQEYKFLFGDDSDFKAIKYIFKNAKKVLSHYTKEQAKVWAKEYNTDKNKFIFFPDYCNESNFVKKQLKFNPKTTINLVLAAAVAPTSYPEEFFLPKGMLRSVKKLSQQNISVSLMVPPNSYDDMIKNKQLYRDIFYEYEFNKLFNVYRGDNLNSSILNPFDFGFFLLEYTTKNEYLNKYTLPSKFAFYLEAGIPMIIHKKHKILTKIVKKYNLGICFDNKDLDNFYNKLNITVEEYSLMIENIKRFRKNFIYSSDKFQSLGL